MNRATPLSPKTADDALAWGANNGLLEAVDSDSPRAATRWLEEAAGPWSGSSYARSDDPEVNPVLRAILSPHGPAVLNAMDSWLVGVADWDIGGWKAIHWAVAHQSEWAVAWSLKNGRGLTERERRDNGQLSRTALMMAVQLGSPEWLEKVLALDEEWGEGTTKLVRADALNHQGPTAIGIALYEMGARAMDVRAGKESSPGQWGACAKILSQRGFFVDSRDGARAGRSAKLACAIALANEKAPGLDALQGAVRLGLSMAQKNAAGTAPRQAEKPFEAAGADADLDWRRALLACGFAEKTDGCWASAASKSIRDWAFGERAEAPRGLSVKNRFAWLEVAKACEESFAAACIPELERPMRGLEKEFLLWAATEKGHEALTASQMGRKTPRSAVLEAWKERLQLADIAAEASPPKESMALADPVRLGARRV